LRKLNGPVSRTKTALVFINQIRMKIGVMFGNPETTTGGNALKFYASVRIDVRKAGKLKIGDEVVGDQVRVRIIKNKVAAPYKTYTFNFQGGPDKYNEVLELGVVHDIIEKSGSWYSYNGERLGQGAANVKQRFIEDKELYKDVRTRVMDIMREQY